MNIEHGKLKECCKKSFEDAKRFYQVAKEQYEFARKIYEELTNNLTQKQQSRSFEDSPMQ